MVCHNANVYVCTHAFAVRWCKSGTFIFLKRLFVTGKSLFCD